MTDILLREVRPEDKALLFEWANEKEVRANSFSAEAIEWKDHEKWFEKLLVSDNKLFILEQDKKPLGQLRLDIDRDQGIINYSLDRFQRGKGYGKMILRLLEGWVMDNFSNPFLLIGYVKRQNIASQKVFEGMGYTRSEEGNSFRYSKIVGCKQFCFIVDGGPLIGLGHIVRSVTLARALRAAGHKVEFLSREEPGINYIKENKFDFFIYHKDSLDSQLQQLKPDCIVVDSYQVDDRYLLNLKRQADWLCYIDDLNAFDYPVDILINGTAAARTLGYQGSRFERLELLGVEYNLIREEFLNLPHRTGGTAQNILITTGGADTYHMTEKILLYLNLDEQWQDLHFHVIVGGGFENPKEIYTLCREYDNVILYENVTLMSEIMLKCDIAIAAGGSTLYELCACGVSILAFAYARNQLPQIKALADKGIIRNLGWYEDLETGCLCSDLEDMVRNRPLSGQQIQEMQRLIDGNGAHRCAERIVEYLKKGQK